jgi:shikimate kinase
MTNIILIGFMGSGKTSIGRKLARKLNYTFIDSDEWIATQENQTITSIFESKGETYFRELEYAFIQSLHGKNEIVLSTGGGMPCYKNAMDLLNSLGTTVYLQRSVLDLAHRVSHSKTKRPLVIGKTPNELKQYIQSMLEIRNPFYEQAKWIADRKIQSHNQLIRFLVESGEILPQTDN